MKDERKGGVFLAYINIALNMCINVFLTPMLITVLSDETYGLYKVIQSIAGPLVLFNLGLGTISTRCIAKYRAVENGDIRKKENTLAMAMVVALTMAVAVLAVGGVVASIVPQVYRKTFSAEQLDVARKLLYIFTVSAAINILTEVLKGCVIGNERFVFNSGIYTFHHALKLTITVLLLKNGVGVLGLAMADMINNAIVLVAFGLYSRLRLHERFFLYGWDRAEFKMMLSFSVAVLLQGIINQVNNNLDMILLGAMVEEDWILTMYSSALTIFATYNMLLSVLTSVFFPKAIQLIERGNTGEELTDFVIVPGRFQAVVATGVLCCFGLFGKEFIRLWIGQKYEDAYYVALFLMIPVTIPLVQNVCLTILDAKLKRMFRSVTLCIMAGINAALSVCFIRVMGFWGALLATVMSFLIGHIILMNIYYQKVIGLNILRMFREIFRGILWCGMVTVLICLPLNRIREISMFTFMVKCTLFCVVYAVLLWKFGWNSKEKTQIKNLMRNRMLREQIEHY